MAKFAKVESLDALKELRAYLCNLASKISLSIDEADYDIQSTLNWLKHDQYPYWKGQITTRKEAFAKAKLEFKRNQYLDNSPAGGGYSNIDEKKAMAIAQRRLEQAEEKVKKIQYWIPEFEKQMYECRASLQGLANLVQIELPKKRAQIDQMIYSLEAYMDLTAPEIAIPSAMAAIDSGEDMSKPVEQIKEKSSGNILERYKQLRDRNPLSRLTNEIGVIEASEIQLFEIKDSDQAAGVIGQYKVDDRKQEGEVTVIVDDSVVTTDLIFIEKVVVGKGDKTNLYITPVEPNDAAKYSALPISDFLKRHPTWHTLLLLPADWFVILKDGLILNIFDADDNLVYEMSGNPT